MGSILYKPHIFIIFLNKKTDYIIHILLLIIHYSLYLFNIHISLKQLAFYMNLHAQNDVLNKKKKCVMEF